MHFLHALLFGNYSGTRKRILVLVMTADRCQVYSRAKLVSVLHANSDRKAIISCSKTRNTASAAFLSCGCKKQEINKKANLKIIFLNSIKNFFGVNSKFQ